MCKYVFRRSRWWLPNAAGLSPLSDFISLKTRRNSCKLGARLEHHQQTVSKMLKHTMKLYCCIRMALRASKSGKIDESIFLIRFERPK